MGSLSRYLTRVFNRNSTDTLSHITGAVDNSLSVASTDIKLLDSEYIIGTSTGDWLDEWGTWFGVSRLMDEEDESYRNRILAICTKPKNTVTSIRETVKAYTGDENSKVIVYEPYTNIRKFNISTWGSQDRYTDDSYYTTGIIDIGINADITPLLMETINQSRSAGTKAYYTRIDELNQLVVKPTYEPYIYNEISIDFIIDYISRGASYSGGTNGRQALSGDKILWIGDNEKSSDLQDVVLILPDTQTSVQDEWVSLYKSTRSSSSRRSEGYGARSGYKLSPIDIYNPLPFIEKPLVYKTEQYVALESSVTILDNEKSYNIPKQTCNTISMKGTMNEVTNEIQQVSSARLVTVDWNWFNEATLEDIFNMPDLTPMTETTIYELCNLPAITTNPIEVTLV